jgi:hypothetical protein
MSGIIEPLAWLHGEIRTPPFAIVVVDVFAKKTGSTPQGVIGVCQERLRRYDSAARG